MVVRTASGGLINSERRKHPILRWYRRLIAQTSDGSARRGLGRPMPRRDVAALVVRMAVEHPQWRVHTDPRGRSRTSATRSLGPR